VRPRDLLLAGPLALAAAGPEQEARAEPPRPVAMEAIATDASVVEPSTAEPTSIEAAALALLHDMEMMVDNQETTGWTIDHYEYEEMMSDAVYSACLTPPEARALALAWANDRVMKLGGPVERARAAGRPVDDLGDLLFATRVSAIAKRAAHAAETQCSPWHDASPSFRGVHSNAERFTLNLETGGVVLIQRAGSERDFGGGFAIRFTGGYGLDHHLSLFAGGELHVTTLFPAGSDTTTRFPIQYAISLPVVLRHRFLMWHHDVSAGPVALFTDNSSQASYGFRVGALVGVSTLRIRHIMPWFGPGIELEYVFENDARPATAAVKGGARLGFDWDF
jgi:hypothetical protein